MLYPANPSLSIIYYYFSRPDFTKFSRVENVHGARRKHFPSHSKSCKSSRTFFYFFPSKNRIFQCTRIFAFVCDQICLSLLLGIRNPIKSKALFIDLFYIHKDLHNYHKLRDCKKNSFKSISESLR